MKISNQLLLFAIFTVANAVDERPEGDITIPLPDGDMIMVMNIVCRTATLVIYTYFLYWTVYNIVKYLVIKKRYKEFSILLYYTFFFGLFVSRIVQTAF